MDTVTLLASMEYSRGRLIQTLNGIEKTAGEKSMELRSILGWRPSPGRAHIAWQAAHCAATHDKYLNVLLLGGTPKDPNWVNRFGGGSVPSDENVPSLPEIRAKLEETFGTVQRYVAGLDTAGLARVTLLPNNGQRTVAESILLLTWHEAHHQGQIHLTWNMFKAAQGIA